MTPKTVRASEKLRALDADMKVFDAGLAELKVLEALPLIADVVEAAEAAAGVLQEASITADHEGWQTTASALHRSHEKLALALTALEEKL